MLPIIKVLDAKDSSQFQELRLLGLKESPTSFASSYEEEAHSSIEEIQAKFNTLWNNPYNLIFGSFLENKLVGCLGLFQPSFEKKFHKVIFWGLYVHPEARRKGLGLQLMKQALLHAKNLPDIKYVELTVESTNQEAKKLYQSLGFQCWGTEPAALKIQGVFYEEEYLSLKL